MLNIIVLCLNGELARHEYLELVDQLRENNIRYRQNFNQLVLTTENTRARFIFNKKHALGLRPMPDIVCGFNNHISDEVNLPPTSNHNPIFYIKQKEID